MRGHDHPCVLLCFEWVLNMSVSGPCKRQTTNEDEQQRWTDRAASPFVATLFTPALIEPKSNPARYKEFLSKPSPISKGPMPHIYIPFLDDPTGREPGDLDEFESWWVERQEALERAGYMLRSRFRPGWQPSWAGTDKPFYDFEDGKAMGVSLNNTAPPLLLVLMTSDALRLGCNSYFRRQTSGVENDAQARGSL